MSAIRLSFLCLSSTAVILTTSLMVGGCSPKDKGPSAEKSAPGAELSLKSPTPKAFAKHFEVPDRKISDDEAKQALEELNLLQSSDEGLSWAKSSGKSGNYSYTDLAAKSDDGTLTIDKAELYGVHMNGETATFDRADFSNIKIYNEDDDVTVTFDALSLARPTPAMAKSIINSLANIKDIDDLGLQSDSGEKSFGAISMTDTAIKSAELNGKIETLIWSEDKNSGLTDMLLDDINVTFEGHQGESGQLALGEFSATGLRSNLFKGISSPTALLGKFGSTGKNFDEVKLDDLSFNSSSVSISTEGFAGKATEKGGVTTIKQSSEPFRIMLKDQPKNPQAAQAFAMVKELGFDELVFQSSQTQIIDSNTDTVTVKDGVVTMKDGFNLDYNYSASGLNQLQKNLKDNGGQNDMNAALSSMTLNGVQFRLEDKSIVDLSSSRN